MYTPILAPKLLYGRKECDLAELLHFPFTSFSIDVNDRGPLVKPSKIHQFLRGGVAVATSTNLTIFIAILSTVLLVIIAHGYVLLKHT